MKREDFPNAGGAEPDFVGLEEHVRARLSRQLQLSSAQREGGARIGGLVQFLRRQQRWSLETLAARSGLSWLRLALLEHGLLLPEELTPESIGQLGRAFPLGRSADDPASLFITLATDLHQIELHPELPAKSPDFVRTTSTGELFVRWLSPLWQPFLAGEIVTAADTAPQQQVFELDEGWIRVTCRWWSGSAGQPASLWLEWYADITQAGTLQVRFTRPNDARTVLAEKPLGAELSGEVEWSAGELGFDPASEPWAITIMLREP